MKYEIWWIYMFLYQSTQQNVQYTPETIDRKWIGDYNDIFFKVQYDRIHPLFEFRLPTNVESVSRTASWLEHACTVSSRC